MFRPVDKTTLKFYLGVSVFSQLIWLAIFWIVGKLFHFDSLPYFVVFSIFSYIMYVVFIHRSSSNEERLWMRVIDVVVNATTWVSMWLFMIAFVIFTVMLLEEDSRERDFPPPL